MQSEYVDVKNPRCIKVILLYAFLCASPSRVFSTMDSSSLARSTCQSLCFPPKSIII